MDVIQVAPLTDVALGHRALHVALADSGHIVALSKEGIGTLLSPGESSPQQITVGGPLIDVAISPDGRRLAVVEGKSLTLIDLQNLTELWRQEISVDACLFSPCGRFLWTAHHVTSHQAVLELRECGTQRFISRATVPDPFGESALMLFRHPAQDSVLIWLAAGQDGQFLIQANFTAPQIQVKVFLPLKNTTPPVFDAAGQKSLVVSGDTLRLHDAATARELATVNWPLEDDPPAESLAFLDSNRAIVQSGNGRLFVVDLFQQGIEAELLIIGHEPRPARELFPLVDDSSLCSDLWSFRPMPSGKVLSVHQDLAPPASNDRLITWRLPKLRTRSDGT